MTRQASGITREEAERLFSALSGYALIVVAVSGGPDSMALLHLVAEWSRERGEPAPDVVAVTVDHQLREEAANEAALVARRARALGLRHETLQWDGPKPATGLPEAAREARYRLLEDFALSLGTSGTAAIVTAHHRDDQAETVLMRLMRGSGLDGLSAIPPARPLFSGSSITLVRPLLQIEKARLVATLEARGETWFEDPANVREDLERGRLRGLLARLEGEGLTMAALARSAWRLGAAREAVDYAEAHFQATLALATNDGIYAALDRQALNSGPALLQQRVLARLVSEFGGATPEPELSEVEALVECLKSETKVVRTLGGAVVSAGPRYVRIFREAGRLDAGALQLEAGQSAIWDKRFKVALSGDAGRRLQVRALGPEGFATLAPHLDRRRAVPSRAAYCLPAFWHGDMLVGVPPLAPRLLPRAGPKTIDLTDGARILATAIYRN